MVVANAFVNGCVRTDCIDNAVVHNGECLLIKREKEKTALKPCVDVWFATSKAK